MSTPANHDALLAACTAFGLDTTGDDATLAQRVGSTVAERLFGTVVGSAAVTSSTSSTPCTQHKRPREDEKKPLSVKAARWHAFAKRERPLVKQAGITGNAEVLKEVAARYKRFLVVGTPDQPPLLAGPSTPEGEEGDADGEEDGLVSALRDLSADEVSQALKTQGVEPGNDPELNIVQLATALMA